MRRPWRTFWYTYVILMSALLSQFRLHRLRSEIGIFDDLSKESNFLVFYSNDLLFRASKLSSASPQWDESKNIWPKPFV